MNIITIALIIAIAIGIASKLAWLIKVTVVIAMILMVLSVTGVIKL